MSKDLVNNLYVEISALDRIFDIKTLNDQSKRVFREEDHLRFMLVAFQVLWDIAAKMCEGDFPDHVSDEYLVLKFEEEMRERWIDS